MPEANTLSPQGQHYTTLGPPNTTPPLPLWSRAYKEDRQMYLGGVSRVSLICHRAIIVNVAYVTHLVAGNIWAKGASVLS